MSTDTTAADPGPVPYHEPPPVRLTPAERLEVLVRRALTARPRRGALELLELAAELSAELMRLVREGDPALSDAAHDWAADYVDAEHPWPPEQSWEDPTRAAAYNAAVAGYLAGARAEDGRR